MLSESRLHAHGRVRAAAETPLAGLIYAMPIALVLWALIALAAIEIF